jgi:hypothetical protein
VPVEVVPVGLVELLPAVPVVAVPVVLVVAVPVRLVVVLLVQLDLDPPPRSSWWPVVLVVVVPVELVARGGGGPARPRSPFSGNTKRNGSSTKSKHGGAHDHARARLGLDASKLSVTLPLVAPGTILTR